MEENGWVVIPDGGNKPLPPTADIWSVALRICQGGPCDVPGCSKAGCDYRFHVCIKRERLVSVGQKRRGRIVLESLVSRSGRICRTKRQVDNAIDQMAALGRLPRELVEPAKAICRQSKHWPLVKEKK